MVGCLRIHPHDVLRRGHHHPLRHFSQSLHGRVHTDHLPHHIQVSFFWRSSLNSVFSMTFTKYILGAVFLYTFVIITLFFQIRELSEPVGHLNRSLFSVGCENYYNPEVWAFWYSGQPVCKVFATYGDFYEILFFTITSAILDMVTIYKVLKMREKTERSKKELNFLKQVSISF